MLWQEQNFTTTWSPAIESEQNITKHWDLNFEWNILSEMDPRGH